MLLVSLLLCLYLFSLFLKGGPFYSLLQCGSRDTEVIEVFLVLFLGYAFVIVVPIFV
jgi:hypothetical protein